ncbi:MAG: hypothetical protein ACK5WP_10095 [Neisseriaceae bacterium]
MQNLIIIFVLLLFAILSVRLKLKSKIRLWTVLICLIIVFSVITRTYNFVGIGAFAMIYCFTMYQREKQLNPIYKDTILWRFIPWFLVCILSLRLLMELMIYLQNYH